MPGVLSVMLALIGLLAIGSVFFQAWNYSAEGAVLLTGGIFGLAGTAIGMRSRSHGSGQAGRWLGLVVAVASSVALLMGEYTIEFG